MAIGRNAMLPRVPALDVGRLMRFSAVSALAFPVTQCALIAFTIGLRSSPVTANVAAVSIASVPAYAANRSWVWGRRGPGRLGEALPFWLLTMVGLAASTVLAIAGHHVSDNVLVVNAANALGFGAVWLLRFFVLDERVFGSV